MIDFVPLLADADWVKLVGALVFLVVYAVNYLIGGNKKNAPAKKNARKPLAPAPLQPADQAKPQNPAQLNDEIEEFLKRATDRRREKGRREVEVPAAAKPQRAKKAPPPKRLVDTSTPQIAPEISAPAAGGGIGSYVSQHLTNNEFDTRAAHLADDITRADAEREQHLKKMFDHKLGRLGDSSRDVSLEPGPVSPTDTTPVQNAAAGLAVVLSNPQNLRQAIVLSEIFERPEHRW